MTSVRSKAARNSVNAVIAEHRELRALRRDVSGLLTGRGGAAWATRLGEKLYELFLRLEEHFALEERSGLFEDLEAALPQADRESARLRSDHDDLLAHLERLREELPRASQPQALGRFKESLSSFLRDLARHEETENALLIRAAEGDEVGGPD